MCSIFYTDGDVVLHQLGLIGHHILEALLFVIHAGRERAPHVSAVDGISSQRGYSRGRGKTNHRPVYLDAQDGAKRLHLGRRLVREGNLRAGIEGEQLGAVGDL